MDLRSHPLFLIFGFALFGVAMAVVVWVFTSNNMTAQRDALMTELTIVAGDASSYRLRSRPLGGGGSFKGYRIPNQLRSTRHAEIVATDSAGAMLTLVATSTGGMGTVSAKLRSDGKLRDVVYSGEFAQ